MGQNFAYNSSSMTETFFFLSKFKKFKHYVDTYKCQDISEEENCIQKNIWFEVLGGFFCEITAASMQSQPSHCSHSSSLNQHQPPLGNHMNQMQSSITLSMSLKQDDLANLFQTSTRSTSWTLSPKYFWGEKKICLFDWNHTNSFKSTSMIILNIFLRFYFWDSPVASLGRNPNYCHRQEESVKEKRNRELSSPQMLIEATGKLRLQSFHLSCCFQTS